MVSVSHANAQELPDRDVNCTLGVRGICRICIFRNNKKE
jgi:hypothetical protein